MIYKPQRVVLTCGIGRAEKQLVSFEMALRSAGIAGFNLVIVSSILPANVIPDFNKELFERIEAGSIIHCVMSRCHSNENNRLLSSAIGVAFHDAQQIAFLDKSIGLRDRYGYISEYHAYGETKENTGKESEEIAKEMLSTIKGDNNFNSMNISESAVVDNEWTTVVAAAILI